LSIAAPQYLRFDYLQSRVRYGGPITVGASEVQDVYDFLTKEGLRGQRVEYYFGALSSLAARVMRLRIGGGRYAEAVETQDVPVLNQHGERTL
jgi:hypothetical protein